MADSKAQKKTPSTDGRALRSERSKQLIISAMHALVEEGNLVPTAQQVSDKAAVGIRTVFRHFSDMESLFNTMDEQIRASYEGLFLGGDREGTLAERILHAAEKHDSAFDKVNLLMQSTKAQLWKSENLRRHWGRNRRALRNDLEDWLPEFAKLSARRQAAAEVAMGFETWHRLRYEQGLNSKETIATINEMVCLLFDVEPL